MSYRASQRSSTSYSSSRSSPTDPYAGAAFDLILEHILAAPAPNDIPLRTMYTLNSTPRAQPSRPDTPSSAFRPAPSSDAAANFQSSLLNQVSNLKSQPCSLPPAFITGFVRKVFPAELTMVDFPQALTALDYLKDLEWRRRREFRAALQRLGITPEYMAIPGCFRKHTGLLAWIQQREDNERDFDRLYSELFIAIRRWILINELSLEPFSKQNCLAMLNTMFPPIPNNEPWTQPSRLLTERSLNDYRAGFFEWIKRVETSDASVLDPVMQQGKRPAYLDERGYMVEDATGWPAVRDALDIYLDKANACLEDCRTVESIDSFDSEGKKKPHDSTDYTLSSGRESRSGRKADSGVSFNSSAANSNKRPSTSMSTHNRGDYAEPPSPTAAVEARFPPAKSGPSSTMEKITNQIRQFPLFGGRDTASKSRPATPSVEQFGRGRRESSATTCASEERTARPRSRAATFIRSLSRPRSSSRPQTATTMRPAPDDPIPPTPTIPANFMDMSDDEDNTRSRRSRRGSVFRRGGRSKSRNGTVRKMRSFVDPKREREDDLLFGFASRVATEEEEELERIRYEKRWKVALRNKPADFEESAIIGKAV